MSDGTGVALYQQMSMHFCVEMEMPVITYGYSSISLSLGGVVHE